MSRFRAATLAALAIVAAALSPGAPAEAQPSLRAPANGSIRALVVGIDDYVAKARLKGAVADARDLAASLRKMGVADLTMLIDQEASRRAIFAAMDRLVRDSKPNDLVIISFAGHGARMPELVRNSKPDHLDEVYVLARFDERLAQGSAERIHGPEMNHWLSQLDRNGVDVLFVADTCHGGGLTRDADLRGEEMSYRVINIGAVVQDTLTSNLTLPELRLDERAFSHVTFLAAVDRYGKTPEVRIAGQPTLRGALSYAVARALEGAADRARKGAVTRRDLVEFAGQLVWQFADTKQRIYYEPSRPDALNSVVFRAGAPPASAPVVAADGVLRIKVIGADTGALAGVKAAVTPFTAVSGNAEADVVWDAARKEAIYGGDIVARNVGAQDIPGVADRIGALRALAVLSQSRPLTFRVAPNDRLHHAGETGVALEASGLRDKYLVAFNIAGNGTIQYLFPLSQDDPRIRQDHWTLKMDDIGEPFGFDQIVAIASDTRPTEVEAALTRYDRTRAAGQVPRILGDYVGRNPQVRIGIAGLVTAP